MMDPQKDPPSEGTYVDHKYARLEYLVMGLQQTVQMQSHQISGLQQTISGLQQAMLTRDHNISGLQQTVQIQGGQISGLQQTISVQQQAYSLLLIEMTKMFYEKIAKSAEEQSNRIFMLETKSYKLKSRIQELESSRRQQRWESVQPLITDDESEHMKEIVEQMDTFIQYEDLVDEKFLTIGSPREMVQYRLPGLDLEGQHGLNYDKLLPYWKEVARIMQTSQYELHVSKSKSSLIHFSGLSFGKPVMDILRPAFRLNWFKHLSFIDNQFGRDGIKFVLDAIENNPYLENFTLAGNEIDQQEDLDRLCDILRSKDRLKSVAIIRCGSPTSVDMLPLLRATEKVQETHLGRNNIHTNWNGRMLAETMSRKQPREDMYGKQSELNLLGNKFDDNDLIEFGIALAGNRQRISVDLTDNNITQKGVEEFYRRTIFNQASLNSVANSNHTCIVRFDTTRLWMQSYLHVNMLGMIVEEKDRQYMHPCKFVRRMKILAYLSPPHEGVKLRLLGGVPFGLAPNIIWLLQQYPVNIARMYWPFRGEQHYVNLWYIMENQLLMNSYDLEDMGNYSFPHDGYHDIYEDQEWDQWIQDRKKLSVTFDMVKGVVAGNLDGG